MGILEFRGLGALKQGAIYSESHHGDTKAEVDSGWPVCSTHVMDPLNLRPTLHSPSPPKRKMVVMIIATPFCSNTHNASNYSNTTIDNTNNNDDHNDNDNHNDNTNTFCSNQETSG